MTTAADVIRVAASRIGLAEQPPGSNNVPGITDWYGIRGAWCAMFVSRTFWDAGMPLPAQTAKGFAWVSAGFDWMRAQGWCTRDITTAQPGDLLAFEWGQTSGGYDHIGICERNEPDTRRFVTIEGNVGDRVQRLYRSWDTSGVLEIARPPFSVTPTPEDNEMASVCVLDPDSPTGMVWECFGLHRRHVNNPDELNVLLFLGAKMLGDDVPADARRFWMRARIPVGSSPANPAPPAGSVDPAVIATTTADELARRLRS